MTHGLPLSTEPDLDNPALRTRTSALVSPVEVAPHCTGGAVDLTLADLTSRSELDMGGAVNTHRTGDERSCPFSAPGLSPAARARRQTLAEAMTSDGFVNYPTESGGAGNNRAVTTATASSFLNAAGWLGG